MSHRGDGVTLPAVASVPHFLSGIGPDLHDSLRREAAIVADPEAAAEHEKLTGMLSAVGKVASEVRASILESAMLDDAGKPILPLTGAAA